MTRRDLEESVLKQLGDPKAVARELASFRRSAKALSSDHPRLIETHPRQWVVVHDGKVVARGQSMQSALLQAKEMHLPMRTAIVRYIDKNERTFIL